MSQKLQLELDGVTHEIDILARRPRLVVAIDGRPCTVDAFTISGGTSEFVVDGTPRRAHVACGENRVDVRLDGRTHGIGFKDAIAAAQAEAGGDDELHADMPGVAVEIHAASGDVVATGDTLLVIESMKMQINITAPRDGVVATVHVEPNATFDKGATLVTLHPADSETE